MKRYFGMTVATALLLIALCTAAEAEFATVSHTTSLNLRSGPGYEYPIISSVSNGEWVNIMGGNGGWDQVSVIRTGKTGYMVDTFLQRASSGGGGIGVVHNPAASGFLNLREYPSYSAAVLGIYYNGATCTILNTLSGWYMVEIEGQIGYFRQEFVQVSGGAQARVTAANGKPVNLRSGPAMSYSSVGALEVGAQVTVLMKGKGFWQIDYQGTTGFMSSAFLKETSGGGGGGSAPLTNGYLIVTSPNQGKVNLRAQPSSSAKVLTQYGNGTRLEVIEGGLNWCKVYGKSSGLTGYIMTRFTTVYGLPGTPIKTVSNGKTYVNLRSLPGTASGRVLARVQSGEKVTVLVPGDEWTQVRYGTIEGYIMTHFLK